MYGQLGRLTSSYRNTSVSAAISAADSNGIVSAGGSTNSDKLSDGWGMNNTETESEGGIAQVILGSGSGSDSGSSSGSRSGTRALYVAAGARSSAVIVASDRRYQHVADEIINKSGKRIHSGLNRYVR